MGTSKRLAPLYDRYAQHGEILAAAKHGPLQPLTDWELDRTEQPMTTCPRPKKVRAWVRFGPESIRVEAYLLRSTPLAAGIQFSASDETFLCWVGATPSSSQRTSETFLH
ncbi:hypothetical protein [Microbacterium sp. LWO12-1.2]|uniref:hypothetical protein n=1 Tax=Microbacterium sp. LWO12-1.2 TaxID=3135261 RepID=UPI00344605D6